MNASRFVATFGKALLSGLRRLLLVCLTCSGAGVERTDYWHRALIHIVDLVLDELDLTSRDSEFRELWKRGYEAHLARVRGGDHKPGDEADQALLAFLRQSPRVLDDGVLSSAIDHLEFVAETRGLHLDHQAKAAAILKLYRESKARGGVPSLKDILASLEP